MVIEGNKKIFLNIVNRAPSGDADMGALVSGGERIVHSAGPDVESLLLAKSYVTMSGHSLPLLYLDFFFCRRK